MPAKIAGCRVLTRPSIISGNPVTSDTFRTGMPAAAIARAVPPVDTSSTPRPASPRAKASRPVLSETLRIARIFIDFLDRPEGGRYYDRNAGKPGVVSRGRRLAVFFY